MPPEPEPSIIEYARYHGLAQDHRASNPLEAITSLQDSFPQSLNGKSQREDDGLLVEECTCTQSQCVVQDGRLVCITCMKEGTHASASELVETKERMFIDADTAKLLISVTRPPLETPAQFDEEGDIDLNRMRRKSLKVALPILHSDHESDLSEAFHHQSEPNLQDEVLPLESLNEEADEGLTWPSKYHSLPDETWKHVTSENLIAPAEALQLIHEIMSFSADYFSMKAFGDEKPSGLSFEKSNLVAPATPPLLPMSPEHIPLDPSAEFVHLDQLSERSSFTKEPSDGFEGQITAQDVMKAHNKDSGSSFQSSDLMLFDSDSVGEVFRPLNGIKDEPSSPPEDRLPHLKLKIEVPLTTSELINHPQCEQKNGSFSECLTELIPTLAPINPYCEENLNANDIDALFEEHIKLTAAKAERDIEQEQLQEDDTLLRVSVPTMDFSVPIAPWDVTGRQAQSNAAENEEHNFLQELRTIHLKDHQWFLSGSVERELQWTPFAAAMGKVDLDEVIHDDGTLAEFLKEPPSMDMSILTWKPEGLRLFDENEQLGTEELEEGLLKDEMDLKTLLLKRKLEINAIKSSGKFQQNDGKACKIPRLFDSCASVGLGSLGDFLKVRSGAADAKLVLAYQSSPEDPTIEDPTPSKADEQEHIKTFNHESTTSCLPAVSPPDIVIPRKRQPFIVSATFLKDRKLIREVQRLFPSAEFVERDWPLHFEAQPILQASMPGQRTTSIHPPTDEADITISPSTGLILTTLQKIKQQALPGQSTQSIIRERVRNVASKYESLIILISTCHSNDEHDHIAPNRDLGSGDCEAVALFIAFCSGLEDETQPIFIASGIEELARWIVTMMVKYSIATSGIPLIQEETLWELFLRRAGVNAFAAQAILGELKGANEENSESNDFGLTAFIKMSPDERLVRFEKIFDGRRLLSKINRVFEARW